MKTICVLLLCIGCTSASAQDSTKKENEKKYLHRISYGAGLGNDDVNTFGVGGISLLLEYGLQKNNTIYSIGFRGITDLGPFFVSPPNLLGGIDITYGKLIQKKSLFASANAGISLVVSSIRDQFLYFHEPRGFFSVAEYSTIKKGGIGIAASTKIYWIPTRYFGVGLELYANINSIHSFYASSFGFQFGRLRFKNSFTKKKKNENNTL
jgi:hypothetical protein